MKKFVAILTMALIFSMCGITIDAAGPMNGRNFTDANADGIYDNYGYGYGCGQRPGCGYGRGQGFGCGYGYVDADADGICDNYGYGCGYGRGQGFRCCKGYVDADADDVCDNIKYSIKYNLKGGKNNKKNPSYYYSTSKKITLKKPTRKGYKFKGWYADKQYKKRVTAIKKGSAGKKVLYAKWKKK